MSYVLEALLPALRSRPDGTHLQKEIERVASLHHLHGRELPSAGSPEPRERTASEGSLNRRRPATPPAIRKDAGPVRSLSSVEPAYTLHGVAFYWGWPT